MLFCNVGIVLFFCFVFLGGYDEFSSCFWNFFILDGLLDKRYVSIVNFFFKGCSVWGECDSESRFFCFGKINGIVINIFSSCGY